jgi:hypothetical protein
LTPDQIYRAPIEAVALYTNEEKQRRRSLRETVVTAAILGGGVGLVLGGVLAVGHRLYFPEVSGLFTATPNGVMVELLIYGALIGASFGTLFGFLIGGDAAEDIDLQVDR